MLSSVANLMLCGVADVHPELETHLARISSLPREGIGGGEGSASKKGRPLRFDQERYDREVNEVEERRAAA